MNEDQARPRLCKDDRIQAVLFHEALEFRSYLTNAEKQGFVKFFVVKRKLEDLDTAFKYVLKRFSMWSCAKRSMPKLLKIRSEFQLLSQILFDGRITDGNSQLTHERRWAPVKNELKEYLEGLLKMFKRTLES